MKLLTDFVIYMASAVPSLVGFILNAFVLANICCSKTLRGKYYQQWSAGLAVANLLAAGSWLMGPKYSNPQRLCAVQEYMFLVGSLCQAVISLFICYVAMAAVVWRDQPSYRRMMCSLGFLLLVSLGLVGGCVYYRTAGLFCSNGIDDFYANGKLSETFLAYFFLFVFPILVIIVTEFFIFLITSRRLLLGFPVADTDPVEVNYRKQMEVFSQRLLAYPVIFICTWIPKMASIIHSIVVEQFSTILGLFAGMSMATCTIFMGLNYFYFQRTYAPFLIPIMKYFGREVHTHSVSTATPSPNVNQLNNALLINSSGDFTMKSSSYTGGYSESTAAGMSSRTSVTQGNSESNQQHEDFYVKFTDDDDNDAERFSVL